MMRSLLRGSPPKLSKGSLTSGSAFHASTSEKSLWLASARPTSVGIAEARDPNQVRANFLIHNIVWRDELSILEVHVHRGVLGRVQESMYFSLALVKRRAHGLTVIGLARGHLRF